MKQNDTLMNSHGINFIVHTNDCGLWSHAAPAIEALRDPHTASKSADKSYFILKLMSWLIFATLYYDKHLNT